MLSLANRISAMGMAVVILVGLTLVAIVEQAVLPSSARRPVGDPRPVSSSGAPAPHAHTAGHSAQSVPAAPATLLSRKVQSVAMTERAKVVRRVYGPGPVAHPVVRVSRIDRRRTWAFGAEAIPPPKGMTSMPDTSLYLARMTRTGWQVALTGTRQFQALLRQAPTSVVATAERAILAKYNTANRVAGNAGLMLPWAMGQSWSLLSTDTGASGFDGGDRRVLAAGDGRLYRLCSSGLGQGLILILHPNGLATEYYQMSDVSRVPDGSAVKRGDYLGQTGTEQPCGGGPAAQRMVRFAVRNADTGLPLDQVQIGGWTLHQTAAEMFADRLGLRVNAGNPLLNFGAVAIPLPETSQLAGGLGGNANNNGKSNGNGNPAGKTPLLPNPGGNPNGKQ